MEESEINAPLYYVMGRDVDPETVQHIFTITPCTMGVVSRHTDKTLIESLVSDILKADDETTCFEMAAHVARSNGKPVLTVGDGREVTVVYLNGEKEALCLSNLTSTN